MQQVLSMQIHYNEHILYDNCFFQVSNWGKVFTHLNAITISITRNVQISVKSWVTKLKPIELPKQIIYLLIWLHSCSTIQGKDATQIKSTNDFTKLSIVWPTMMTHWINPIVEIYIWLSGVLLNEFPLFKYNLYLKNK
jgi:hypothetical protein